MFLFRAFRDILDNFQFWMLFDLGTGSWTYHNQAEWPSLNANCGGFRQSPIDIPIGGTKNPLLRDFHFSHYDYYSRLQTLTNNGHSVQISYSDDVRYTVGGGGLNGNYELLQYHFHWGSDDTKGSEHTINGKRYPLEAHFVHWKKSYNTVQNALSKPDGLAVLAVFFEMSDYDNPFINSIIDPLNLIIEKETSTKVRTIPPPKYFLPHNTRDYYRYSGSLTTPSCNEVVTWTIFKDTLRISSRQLAAFRQLKGRNRQRLVDIYRDTQSINGRIVQQTF